MSDFYGTGNNALRNAVISSPSYIFTINPSQDITREPFGNVHLKTGTYYISYYQDIDLSSTVRNRLSYQRIDISSQRIYETSDNLNSGLHEWSFYISDEGDYSIKIWIANPSSTVKLSNFILRGMTLRQWADKLVETNVRESILNLIAFANDAKPIFTVDSLKQIEVTFPSNQPILLSYVKKNGTYRTWIYVENSQSQIVVPSGYMIVYDIDDALFYITNETSFNISEHNYIICFLNNNGYVNGQWRRYIVESEISTIKKSINYSLPEYYDGYVENKIDEINRILMESNSGDSFIFITDIHVDGNSMNSPALVHSILSGTSIDKVVLNGDYIQQESTKQKALTKINDTISRFNYINTSTYNVVGNHEFNTNGTIDPAPELTWNELYYPIIKRNENKIVTQANGLGYYWLNESQKIKYMVADYNSAGGMNYSSVKFIINNLTNTPQGYTIVCINHGGLKPDGTLQSGMDEIISAMDAIRTHSTYTLEGQTYNFSNADYTVACLIVGHYHEDYSYTSSSGIPLISVTCDSYLYNLDSDVTRTKGTTSEQAFDVFVVNTYSRTIKTIRVGGGQNRNFSY